MPLRFVWHKPPLEKSQEGRSGSAVPGEAPEALFASCDGLRKVSDRMALRQRVGSGHDAGARLPLLPQSRPARDPLQVDRAFKYDSWDVDGDDQLLHRLIALPDIFRGIELDPLAPGNTGYMLWMLMGFMVVTAVLVVSLRPHRRYVRQGQMYDLGFAVFTLARSCWRSTWFTGRRGRIWLIAMRVGQGLGAPCSSPTRRRSSPTPSRLTSVDSASGSTTSPPSPAPSSGSSSEGCSAPVEWHLCS